MFHPSECVEYKQYLLGWHEGMLQITLTSVYEINKVFSPDRGVLIPSNMIYESWSNANFREGIEDIISDFDEEYKMGAVNFELDLSKVDYENIINFCEYSSRWQDAKYPNTWTPLDISERTKVHKGYNKWVKSVILRDKVCKCCGLDKHLEAHHLFGYSENQDLATNEQNGVTLCKFCHKKYHSVYGLKNINPIDFIDFIKKYGVK